MEIRHGGNLQEMKETYEVDALIDFSANINPLGMPTSVQQALSQAVCELEHYPDVRYLNLRRAISKHHGLDEAWVYPANGAAEAIFNLASVLHIKQLALLAPTFMEYEGAFRNHDTQFSYFELAPYDFNLSMGRLLLFLETEGCDGICLCNPNNPTGKVLSRKELMPLLDFCKNQGLKMIIDEAFIDFTDEAENSLVSELEHYSDLFILRSLTKMYAIPGVRVGYLLTANHEVLNKIERLTPPWHVNTFAALAGQAALQDTAFVEKTQAVIKAERDYLVSELHKFGDCLTVYHSDVNYLFFEYCSSANLQEQLIQRGLLIRKCDSFRGLAKNYYRIAVKDHFKNQQLIAALEEIL